MPSGPPSRIWAFVVQSLASGELLAHLKVTLYEEILGFALGMGGGTAIGLGLWWSRRLSRILEPFAIVFNGIPKIALAPPMIVWFGIFETSKIVRSEEYKSELQSLMRHSFAVFCLRQNNSNQTP